MRVIVTGALATDAACPGIRHNPRAMINRIEDAGHYVLEDAPGESVARISDFLGGR